MDQYGRLEPAYRPRAEGRDSTQAKAPRNERILPAPTRKGIISYSYDEYNGYGYR